MSAVRHPSVPLGSATIPEWFTADYFKARMNTEVSEYSTHRPRRRLP